MIFTSPVPSYIATKLVKMVKSNTSKEIFNRLPEVKKQLWGGEFWSKGYIISTIGRHGSKNAICQYIKKQGSEKHYKRLHREAIQMQLI